MGLLSIFVLLTLAGCQASPVTDNFGYSYQDAEGWDSTVAASDGLFDDMFDRDGDDGDDDDAAVHEDPDPNDELVIPGNNDTDRIIGGFRVSSPRTFPFAASLSVTGIGSCGGTLISSVWVLTAAHCITPGASRISVRVGSLDRFSGGQFRTASRWWWPSAYRHIPNSIGGNDIGLIRLSRRVSFNSNVQPALLVNRNYVPSFGTRFNLVGWGRTSPTSNAGSRFLKGAVESVRRCTSIPVNTPNPSRSMICVLGTNNFDRFCNGDSGGFHGGRSSSSNRWIVVGVTSWHFGSECLGPQGVTSVSYFNPFIWNVVNNN